MKRRSWLLLVLVAVVLGWPLQAHCADDAAKVDGPALKAVPGTRVALTCETDAVGMEFTPFKTTRGTLSLVLMFDAVRDPDDESGAGRDEATLGSWTGSVSGDEHAASLGVLAKTVCAKMCLVRQTPDGNMELWAPRPVMPSTLGEKETLTIATLDVDSLSLKATSFRGQQLSILEKGTCKIASP